MCVKSNAVDQEQPFRRCLWGKCSQLSNTLAQYRIEKVRHPEFSYLVARFYHMTKVVTDCLMHGNTLDFVQRFPALHRVAQFAKELMDIKRPSMVSDDFALR